MRTLPIVDQNVLAELQLVLAPTPIDIYLRSLLARGEALLDVLHARPLAGWPDEDLADASHEVAGNMEMFGFRQAATIGRQFEAALREGSASADVAEDFAAAILVALGAIRHLIERTSLAV